LRPCTDLQLQKIINTWKGLSLEYTPFKATGVNILQQPGEVFEALDDNEVALQNMMSALAAACCPTDTHTPGGLISVRPHQCVANGHSSLLCGLRRR
jgi:hypothetical protein